jgi:hypothetical protein
MALIFYPPRQTPRGKPGVVVHIGRCNTRDLEYQQKDLKTLFGVHAAGFIYIHVVCQTVPRCMPIGPPGDL